MALQESQEEDTSKKERRRKRRWGTAAAAEAPSSAAAVARPGVGLVPATLASPHAIHNHDKNNKSENTDPKAKILAMQESIKARLAAVKQQQQQQQQQQQTETLLPVPITASSETAASEKVKAMQASIQARLQALKASQQQQQQQQSPQPQTTADAIPAVESRPTKRAKHFELDMSVTVPTFRQKAARDGATMSAPAASTKKANPYLAYSKGTPATETLFDGDERLGRVGKERVRNKAMKFVEPGTFTKLAEIKREKIAKAQASGFISGRKVGHSVFSTGMAEIYGAGSTGDADTTTTGIAVTTTPAEDTIETLPPRWDAHPDTKMPLAVEWWDMELLPNKLRKKVATVEAQALSKQTKAALQTLDSTEEEIKDSGDAENEKSTEDLRALCFSIAKLSHSRTSELVQHIVPVKPPNADTGPAKEPVLHLTKKERRRQRKLRRREQQREQQDLQAAGLIPAPEPRLTLQNFIRVLGDQAFVDPSQIEKKVMEQVEARKQAHLERNESSKLTKEQRAAKLAKKLEEDTTQGVHVAVFYVKDMSHAYHRAKVDLNAQQFNITGGVVESENPPMACVVCEGGPKAIKKYIRLMTVRMKWTGPDDADSDDEEDNNNHVPVGEDTVGERVPQKFNPNNRCELVWQGMSTVRKFHGFVFQSCGTADQARKVLKTKGVSHYWDQVTAHANGQSSKLGLRMGKDSDDGDDAAANPFASWAGNDQEDVIMRED